MVNEKILLVCVFSVICVSVCLCVRLCFFLKEGVGGVGRTVVAIKRVGEMQLGSIAVGMSS